MQNKKKKITQGVEQGIGKNQHNTFIIFNNDNKKDVQIQTNENYGKILLINNQKEYKTLIPIICDAEKQCNQSLNAFLTFNIADSKPTKKIQRK